MPRYSTRGAAGRLPCGCAAACVLVTTPDPAPSPPVRLVRVEHTERRRTAVPVTGPSQGCRGRATWGSDGRGGHGGCPRGRTHGKTKGRLTRGCDARDAVRPRARGPHRARCRLGERRAAAFRGAVARHAPRAFPAPDRTLRRHR